MSTPPTPALTAVLDELDELRAKATRGEWHVATSGGIDAGDYDTVIGRGDVDCMSHCYGGTSTLDGDNLPADAALIVAEHNAVPQLTAALRAVLAKHRPIGGPSHFDGDESDYCDDDGFIWPCSTFRAITTALASPAPAPQGGGQR